MLLSGRLLSPFLMYLCIKIVAPLMHIVNVFWSLSVNYLCENKVFGPNCGHFCCKLCALFGPNSGLIDHNLDQKVIWSTTIWTNSGLIDHNHGRIDSISIHTVLDMTTDTILSSSCHTCLWVTNFVSTSINAVEGHLSRIFWVSQLWSQFGPNCDHNLDQQKSKGILFHSDMTLAGISNSLATVLQVTFEEIGLIWPWHEMYVYMCRFHKENKRQA
jgi:hypothetical protein